MALAPDLDGTVVVTFAEGVTVALATLTALGAVFQVSNKVADPEVAAQAQREQDLAVADELERRAAALRGEDDTALY